MRFASAEISLKNVRIGQSRFSQQMLFACNFIRSQVTRIRMKFTSLPPAMSTLQDTALSYILTNIKNNFLTLIINKSDFFLTHFVRIILSCTEYNLHFYHGHIYASETLDIIRIFYRMNRFYIAVFRAVLASSTIILLEWARLSLSLWSKFRNYSRHSKLNVWFNWNEWYHWTFISLKRMQKLKKRRFHYSERRALSLQ